MRKRSLIFAFASGLVTLTMALTPSLASAKETTDPPESDSGSSSQTTDHVRPVSDDTPQAEDTNENTTEHSTTETHQKGLLDNRLDNVKLKVCQQHQRLITEHITNSVKRAQNQLTLFDTIASRVEQFYTNKGKTVANYADLLAAVNNAKTKAQTDLTALQQADTFDCSSSDPKGALTTFKTALEQERQDLKDYRTSIKNLIVGVRSANGDQS